MVMVRHDLCMVMIGERRDLCMVMVGRDYGGRDDAVMDMVRCD